VGISVDNFIESNSTVYLQRKKTLGRPNTTAFANPTLSFYLTR